MQQTFEAFKRDLSGKGLARYLTTRLQSLPIRTAREVFPQAAHPIIFVKRVMRPIEVADTFIDTRRHF